MIIRMQRNKFWLCLIICGLLLYSCKEKSIKDPGGKTISEQVKQKVENSDSTTIQLEELVTIPKINFTIKKKDAPRHYFLSKIDLRFQSKNQRLETRVFNVESRNYNPDPNDLRFQLRRNGSDTDFNRISELSPIKFLSLFTENDIMVSGDQYYTNGSRITWVSPFIARFPISKLLLPYPGKARNYYGISIIQNMYTPSHPDDDKPRPGDRPFAGYMYISHFKRSIDLERKLRLISSIDLGVIGPASFGGKFQRAFHDKEPKDWIIQIENDLLINYNIQFEKAIIGTKFFEFDVVTALQAGSLYDNVRGGGQLLFGRINPFMASFIRDEFNNHNFDLFFRINYFYQYKIYDATLQGGLFNKNSPYVLEQHLMKRVVKSGSATMNLRYGHHGMEFGLYYLSPEFEKGISHRWWRLCLTFGL